jgi:two-component system, OmpR family, response regulator
MIISALSDVRSKLRCFELGACDYVTKPFAVAELVARVQVRSCARPELRSAERFLDADGFRLDLNKRRIVAEAGPIPLSTREFALLEHLMRRSGVVCSRDELLEAVWGYSFNAITNVLEVYIAKLRHKLGADCIQTVRGRGYSFSGA